MKNIRNKAFKDYKQGMKIADIAEKYGVSFNTVKSWARRHWKLKQGAEVATKSNRSNRRVQPRSHGAPKGSQNNLIHGGYSKVRLEESNEEAREFINYIECDPEQIVKDVITFYMLRERRLFKQMYELNQIKGMDFYTSVTHITRRKIGNKTKKTVIHTPAPFYSYMAISKELTKISSAKTEAAVLLHKLQNARKTSSGTIAKIYSMAETAEKADARINKVIGQCTQYAA